jgi:hypothetical protein
MHSSGQQNLVAFDEPTRRDAFLTFGAGAGLHMPQSALPDNDGGRDDVDGEPTGPTFITTTAAVVVKRKMPPASPVGSPSKRRPMVAPLVVGRSVEDERAEHPDWNERFQVACDAEDESGIAAAIRGFEEEVYGIVQRMVLARAGQVAVPLTPLDGYHGRYLHRGVYYLDPSMEPSLLRFYGSVEAVHKAMDAELRCLRHIWRSRSRGGVTVPLATVVTVFGWRFFAVAMPPITQNSICGGPQGPSYVKIATHRPSSLALQHLSEQLHLPPVYLSRDHRTRWEHMPLLGSPEAVLHAARDGRVYMLEVARLMPPTEPKTANALLSYQTHQTSLTSRPPSQASLASTRTSSSRTVTRVASPREERGLAHLLQTSPNRFTTAARRHVAYRLMRPEVLTPFSRQRVTVATENGPHNTILSNSIDGLSPVAFTALSTPLADSLSVAATAAIVERGVEQSLALAAALDTPITAEALARRLQEAGVNLRYIGDVFRALIANPSTAAAGRKSDGPSSDDDRLTSQGSMLMMASQTFGNANSRPPASLAPASPLAISAVSGPATARGAAKPLKPIVASPRTARPRRASCVSLSESTALGGVSSSAPLPPPPERIAAVLNALRVEAVARCFRAVVEEHWRACAQPPPTKPPPAGEDRLAEDSVLAAAERSYVRGKSRMRAGPAAELHYWLRALGENIETAGEGVRFTAKQPEGSPVRSLVASESLAGHRVRYCPDQQQAGAGGQSTESAAATIAERVRGKAADLLSLLLVASPAADRFWDVSLLAEVWTKYNGFGSRQELRAVPPADLLVRVAQLLGITFKAGGGMLVAASVAGAVLPQHVDAIAPRIKGFLGQRASGDVRVSTAHSPLQSVAAPELARLVLARREGPPSSELVASLTEQEHRLVFAGLDSKSELQLVRQALALTERRLREARLREAWTAFGLDGVVYVPCRSCPLLLNPSIRDRHRCVPPELAEGMQPTVERLPVPVGLGDGSLLDKRITASSFKEGCRPEFARLHLGVRSGWEPEERDGAQPWLQLELPAVRSICAVAVQGSPSGNFCRSFQVRYSTDGRSWALFQGAYQHENTALKCEPQRHSAAFRSKDDGSWLPVAYGDRVVRLPVGGLFGNTDSAGVVTNTFERPFAARFLRIQPTPDGHGGGYGLRLEVFATDDHPIDAATYTPGDERVPLHMVDLDAPLVPPQRPDGFAPPHAVTRRDLAEKEVALLEAIAGIEADVYDVDGPTAVGRRIVRRHSSELPQLYLQWLALLDEWGAERAGDATAGSSRLSMYYIGEAELAARGGRRVPTRLVADITPLIFAAPKSSVALEPLLRRLRALYHDRPAAVRALFTRVARWAGKTNMIQPYIAAELAALYDGDGFAALARGLLDHSLATTREPTEADGPALIDDSPARRGALLVYTHRRYLRAVEASDRVSIDGPLTVAEEVFDVAAPAYLTTSVELSPKCR